MQRGADWKRHRLFSGWGAVRWIEETAKTADEVLGNVFANPGRPDVQMRQAKDVISQLL